MSADTNRANAMRDNAVGSLINAVATFNAKNRGYETSTMILLSHALESLYKAVHADSSSETKEMGRFKFVGLVNFCWKEHRPDDTDMPIITKDEAKVSMIVYKIRNSYQHGSCDISEELLYVLVLEVRKIFESVLRKVNPSDDKQIREIEDARPLTYNPKIYVGNVLDRDYEEIRSLVSEEGTGSVKATMKMEVFVSIDYALFEWENEQRAPQEEGGKIKQKLSDMLDSVISDETSKKSIRGLLSSLEQKTNRNPDHSDRDQLKWAISVLADINKRVNERLKKGENRGTVLASEITEAKSREGLVVSHTSTSTVSCPAGVEDALGRCEKEDRTAVFPRVSFLDDRYEFGIDFGIVRIVTKSVDHVYRPLDIANKLTEELRSKDSSLDPIKIDSVNWIAKIEGMNGDLYVTEVCINNKSQKLYSEQAYKKFLNYVREYGIPRYTPTGLANALSTTWERKVEQHHIKRIASELLTRGKQYQVRVPTGKGTKQNLSTISTLLESS